MAKTKETAKKAVKPKKTAKAKPQKAASPRPKTTAKKKAVTTTKKTTAKKPKTAVNKENQKQETSKLDDINPLSFLFCVFCRERPDEANKRLIVGPGNIGICDQCVAVCAKILLSEEYEYEKNPSLNKKSKQEIQPIYWRKRLTEILAIPPEQLSQKEKSKPAKSQIKKDNN